MCLKACLFVFKSLKKSMFRLNFKDPIEIWSRFWIPLLFKHSSLSKNIFNFTSVLKIVLSWIHNICDDFKNQLYFFWTKRQTCINSKITTSFYLAVCIFCNAPKFIFEWPFPFICSIVFVCVGTTFFYLFKVPLLLNKQARYYGYWGFSISLNFAKVNLHI